MAERIPPHSDDAEKSVLGAVLQSKDTLYEVMDALGSEDFYREQHAEIFAAMKALHDSRQSVDIITVAEELSKRKTLSTVGGRAYLAELAGEVPSVTNALQYGKIIKEKSMLRQLLERAGEIVTSCFEDKQKTEDILDKAENSILEIAQGNQRKEGVRLIDAVESALSQSRKYQESGRDLLGLTTGITRLDKLTQGLQKKDLIILAARPSMGKTALALNIALNAAKKADASIMIFSLEMGEMPLSQRMLSTVAKVELNKIKDGSIYNSTEESKNVKEALDIIGNLDIIIDETSAISINEMKNKCRRKIQRSGKLDLIIIDYLQLMTLKGYESRTLEIQAISRMLKEMAKEMDCPVLVLSQTSRDYEKRKGRPMLSDLRDSGAIEQDADVVMFIHNKADREDDDDEEGFTYRPERNRELLILKHRNGETGDVILTWQGEIQHFGEQSFYNNSNFDDSERANKEDLPWQ